MTSGSKVLEDIKIELSKYWICSELHVYRTTPWVTLLVSALDLQYCGIGEAGARELSATLRYNTCLVVLDVRNNPLIG